MSVFVTFVGSGDAFGSGGRFQTCILVDAPGFRLAIDFGASSLIALNKLGISHNSIDAVVLTHLHGDHCGGVPFLLVDAMLGAKRGRPLLIAGPRDTETRMAAVNEAMFPGMAVMTPKFDLTYLEMPVMRPSAVGPATVTPFPAAHVGETHPTSVRVEIADRVVSYTGDSAWTKHLPAVAADADLFIAECYFHAKSVKNHLNYPDIVAHRQEITAKRTVLTHMAPEMLAEAADVDFETAHDGLVIEL
ncbi:MAG: MBL fold metallo-hydrolase [Proteobacteria bacterium]|nr:MBL fold metallo-hydrolase [Pseudomonadota bacterium]